jgi:hypothetical protein
VFFTVGLPYCSAHVCRKSRRNRECTQVANPKRIEGEALSVLNGAVLSCHLLNTWHFAEIFPSVGEGVDSKLLLALKVPVDAPFV